jgi:TonB family protein
MIKLENYTTHGAVGTILVHVIIFLLLFFFGLRSLIPEEEGLLVNFGDSQTGMGMEEPMESQQEPVEQYTPPPPSQRAPVVSQSEKEEINTQDFEEAAAVKAEKKKKTEKEKAERVEKELKRKEALEAKRIRDEEIRQQKAAEEAERKKQEEINRQIAATQSRVKGAFGGKGTGANSSEGDAGGTGNQGYVTGDPNSKNRVGGGTGNGSRGSGYSLSGRSLVGTLPKPYYQSNEEGTVVVEIVVDRNGNVINANPVLKGTTTSDPTLRKAAVDAAMKAKFNADAKAVNNQKGTITYKFSLQ